MSTYTINGEIRLEAPEGFKLMTAEEMAKISNGDASGRFGLWDKEHHVMLLADWKRYNALWLKLTDIRKIAKRNEELNRKPYANFSYKGQRTLSRTIGGLEAEGYRFSFRVEDVSQSAACMLVLHGNNVYRFTMNGRTENLEENEDLFAAVLDSVKFS